MTPAPDTGRTAEEMRAELAALRVENEALRTANAQLADDDWEPHPSLFAKRGETIGHVVKPERYKALLAAEAEAAQLRARLEEAEKGAEAMPGDPGRTAYEARFAHARPRDVEPWDSLTPEVKAIWARVERASAARAEAENATLRASLAHGNGPCAYCDLPKADWSKCASGFPGCSRADDGMLCPHVGAELEAEEKLASLAGMFGEICAELHMLRYVICIGGRS